ncbi:putative ABC transport system permease protein [Winogradskyella eximia]|uniref:Putative ABC transport system permease protein n=1 Tax=Winogradskyella eximia TaxID=262006 RepID=A0A3D9HE22_9FLAO|nr:FtsX-like permease family protein [Winogradskyella eximia]RED47236.1 putative ABC transport system permease protein [Winogradskyella eximia]
MIKNNIKLAWRSIRKNRLFSMISLTGLTLGLLACISVVSVVLDDFSYDSQWSRKDDIHRLLTNVDMGNDVSNKMSASWAGLRPALMDNFPEVEAVTNIYTVDRHIKKNIEDTDVIDLKALETDSLIWDLFDFKVISGNPKQFIHGKSNLVLTKTLKDKLFPDEDVIGKIVFSIPSFGSEPTPFLITGIIENIPSNTHLRAEALIIEKGRLEALYKEQYGSFTRNYVLFKTGTDVNKFSEKLNTWYTDFVGGETKYSYEFQPISDTYLNSEFDNEIDIKGNRSTDYILLGVAILVLFIACVNFVNLSVARSLTRIKEVGVRKVIGADRKQIITQFLVESLMYFVIASLIALPTFYLIIPFIEQFIGHALQVSLLSSLEYLSLGFVAVFIVAVITGTYPAFLISGFKPMNSLKGLINKNEIYGQQFIQKGLVVVQFSIAIIVLVSVFIVKSQLDFINNKDLGYDEENLLAINPTSWDGKGESFHKEITNIPGVTSASLANWRPTFGSGGMLKSIDNPNNLGSKMQVWFIAGDVHLPKTLGVKLISGRLFDEKLITDAPQSKPIAFNNEEKKVNTQPSILTEFTANALQVTKMNTTIPELETNPIGIVKSFHTQSLRYDFKPVVIVGESNPDYSSMLIRVKEGTSSEVTAKINKIWKQMFPNKYLAMNWVDDLVEKQYLEEDRLQSFFSFFSMLSLLLSAIGVFGLVAQSTEQRIKEIGVRKVLGASVKSIVVLFSKDYVKLVAIAIVIALPIAWFATSKWLQDFAYRISVEWVVLLLAASIVLVIALTTVVVQSIRAAIRNPIKSLRTE